MCGKVRCTRVKARGGTALVRRPASRDSLLEAGRRLRAVRVSRNRDRGRTLIEPELRQLEPLVVVIPEVPGQRAVKEWNAIQNAIAVDVGINVEQVLADVVKR